MKILHPILCFALVCVSGCGTNSQQGDQRADGSVIQSADNGAVYIILGGKRRHIPNPTTLEALGVTKSVSPVPASVANSIPVGEPMPSLPGRLIQKASTGEVFLLEAGKRRHVPNPDTLAALNFADRVHGVPDATADAIPLGLPLSHTSPNRDK